MIMRRLPPPVQAQLAAGGKRSLLLMVTRNAVRRYLSPLPHGLGDNQTSVAPQWTSSVTTLSSHPVLRANHQSP